MPPAWAGHLSSKEPPIVKHCTIIDILTCADELDHCHVVLRMDADSPAVAEIRIEREAVSALRDALDKVILLLAESPGGTH